MEKKKSKGRLWIVLTAVFAVLAIVFWVGLPIADGYATVINGALNVKTQKIIPDENATIYFWTEYDDVDELSAHEAELCRQLEAEGAALLCASALRTGLLANDDQYAVSHLFRLQSSVY